MAFQLEQREQSYIERDDFHYLFLIEANNKFKRILCTGDQESNHFTCDLNIDFSFHPGLTDLLLKSQQQRWLSLMLSENSIVSLRLPNGDSSAMISTLYSTHSKLEKNFEYLEFKQERIMSSLRKQSDLNWNQEKINAVLSVNEVSWMDKLFYEVVEGHSSYFYTCQHTSSRTIDMMRIDTKATMLEDMVLIGNTMIGIKIKFTNQYLIYSQSEFNFLFALPYQRIGFLTNAF